ncbi:putative cytochrome P450 pisatin demethylase [Bisporella sp. PMI_857]|nr:putative cytochrome P450 pisatin demethylase [Bisporella sp. PMI_857]
MSLRVLAAVVLIATLRLWYVIYRAITSPLLDVPRPFLARFTRLWKLYTIYRGRFEKVNISLHQKYGPVVRIAPNEYSLDDPEAVSIIYGIGGDFRKSHWYIASGNPDPNGPQDLFSIRDPKNHASMCWLVASLYSMSNLVKLEPYVDHCSEVLKLPVDMAHWLQCYAFDVIGEIAVAKPFGFMGNGDDINGIMASVSQYLFYAAHVGIYSEWHRTASWISSYISSGKGRGAMTAFTNNCVNEKLSEKESEHSLAQCNFLNSLMAQHKADPEKITMIMVTGTCRVNIGAGSDTTSISLSSVIYNLCRNPGAMQSLRDKIDGKAAVGEISDPVTFQEAQKMPYLQAVIKEAIRVHPATGLPLGRVVPRGGKLIAGRMFPEDTVVGINSWVAHANKEVFGSDASSFRPEQWLEDPERSKGIEKYFFTFGIGFRTCIGKNISLLEMTKMVPQLIRNFDIMLDNDGWHTRNSWFAKPYDFQCRVAPRLNKG